MGLQNLFLFDGEGRPRDRDLRVAGQTQQVLDAAFNSFDHCHAARMHERWPEHELKWCKRRMNSTACGAGELPFPTSVAPKPAPGASEAAVLAALGAQHAHDFYTGWSSALLHTRGLEYRHLCHCELWLMISLVSPLVGHSATQPTTSASSRC